MNTIAIKIIIILVFIFCHNIFAIDCQPFFSEKDRSKLDSYYKDMYKYTREGLVANCNDSLSSDYIEIDPRPCGGMLDGLYSFCFNNSIDDKLVRKCERIDIYKNDDGKKRTIKEIYCGNFFEKIVTIHDKKDSLLFSKHYKWNGKMLIQTIDDGITRKIIPGKTPCYFTIVESSGDFVYFELNPKKVISGSIKNRDNFTSFIDGSSIFHGKYSRSYGKEYGEYDAIVYHWHSFCKTNPEFEILIDTNDFNPNLEEDTCVSIKGNDSSPSHTSPYKYYAIIAVCIAVASVAIIRKRRKARK